MKKIFFFLLLLFVIYGCATVGIENYSNKVRYLGEKTLKIGKKKIYNHSIKEVNKAVQNVIREISSGINTTAMGAVSNYYLVEFMSPVNSQLSVAVEKVDKNTTKVNIKVYRDKEMKLFYRYLFKEIGRKLRKRGY